MDAFKSSIQRSGSAECVRERSGPVEQPPRSAEVRSPDESGAFTSAPLGVGGVCEKRVNKFNFTEASSPETLCLSAFAESGFGRIGTMKILTRTCSDCGSVKIFRGEDAKQIMAAMDAIDWQMMPGNDRDLCAACYDKQPEPCCDPE